MKDLTPLILFVLSLIISLLFFGGVHAWVYTLVFLLILTGNLLLIKSRIVQSDKKSAGIDAYTFRWPKTGMLALFSLFVIYLILQMIPLPDSLLLMLSPEAKAIGNHSLPAISATDPGSLKGQWFSLTPYVYPVRMSLIRWIAYGLLFFGLIQTLNSRKRIETLALVILIVGTFISLYGIMEAYSRHGHIWWFKKASGFGEVTGTYINRNHFAGLMEMGIVLVIGYAGAYAAIRKKTGTLLSYQKRSFKQKLIYYLSGERLFTRRFLILFCGVVMGLGLILSASRGGIIAGALSLLVMGLLFVFRKQQRRKGIIVLALFALTSVYAIQAGIDYTVGRFMLFDQDHKDRILVFEKTGLIFEDFKITGAGVGNFQYTFPKYQDAKHKQGSFRFGHNDWMQFLAEAGMAGFFLLLAGAAWFIIVTFRRWMHRSDAFGVCFGAAAFAALTAIAVHSYSDFNLHIPANFMMLAAILAIGVSALHLEEDRHKEAVRYDYFFLPLKRGGLLAVVVFAGIIFWSGQWLVRHYVAETYCNTVPNSTLNLDENPPLSSIRQAMWWDGGNAGYPFKAARNMMNERDKDAQKAGGTTPAWHASHEPIIATLEQAIRRNPFNAEYHEHLGWEYSYMTQQDDYMDRWMPAADLSMERAGYVAGNWVMNPRIHVSLGHYWTMRSRMVSDDTLRQEPLWNRAVWHYRKALELLGDKPLSDEITKYVKNFYPDEEHLKEIME